MTDPRQRAVARPSSVGYAMGERERVLARRRMALIILIVLVPITLVAAIMTGSILILVVNLVADVLIAVYVAMLLLIKQSQGDRPPGSGRPAEDVRAVGR